MRAICQARSRRWQRERPAAHAALKRPRSSVISSSRASPWRRPAGWRLVLPPAGRPVPLASDRSTLPARLGRWHQLEHRVPASDRDVVLDRRRRPQPEEAPDRGSSEARAEVPRDGDLEDGPPASGGSSMAVTDRASRPLVTVAAPCARRLRTQSTSPKGDWTKRRPSCSRIATGNVLGRPVLRPRTVSRTLGPKETPERRRRLMRGLRKAVRPRPRGSGMAVEVDMSHPVRGVGGSAVAPATVAGRTMDTNRAHGT